MKVFVITLFAVAFLSADASPKPGGYTLKGGVDKRYIYDKPEGYYRPAQNAGKMKPKILIWLPSIIAPVTNSFIGMQNHLFSRSLCSTAKT